MADPKADRAGYAAEFIKGDWATARFVNDQTVDNLLSVVVSLGAELWATRRRQMVVEAILAKNSLVSPQMIESYQPTDAERAQWAAERDDTIDRGLRRTAARQPPDRWRAAEVGQSAAPGSLRVRAECCRRSAMINRRDAVKSTAVAALVVAAGVESVEAMDTIEVFVDPENLTDKQKTMLSIRFDTLDGESHQDFVSGFKSFQARMVALPSATARVQALLESKGLSMLEETTLGHEECWNLLMQDPVYATNMRLDSSCQHVMWDRARRVFHKNSAHYLKLLDESDHAGPGKLELNPGLKYPDYACLEIHAQPGGYVGDPLGGWVYHYAVTLGYRAGSAFHDENHIRYANSYVKPADGVVRRVLDIGCGTGQSTTPMKMRFPNAAVWGVDVAAPFVRYAHHRARTMGLDVNFRHALGEATGFPDNHFDMVYSSIVFHEVRRGRRTQNTRGDLPRASSWRDVFPWRYAVHRPSDPQACVDGYREGFHLARPPPPFL